MNKSIVALSAAVTLCCCLLLIHKNREIERISAKAAAATQRGDEALALAAAADEERRLAGMQAEQAQWAQPLANTSQLAGNPRNPANPAPQADVRNRNLSSLFRDEAMKAVLKSEAKLGVAKNVNALFRSGLAQQLNLTEDQSAALKQLLLQKATLLWDQMLVPMATEDLDDTAMAAAGKQIRQALETNAAELRGLLGESGYEVYQWFDKTQVERDRFKQCLPEFKNAGDPLTPDQQAQLLSLMVDERANFRFQFDLGDPLQLDLEHWYDNYTEEKIGAYFHEMEQLDAQMAVRSQALLTPQQSALFKELLSQQLRKAEFTARMTTATFGRRH
jgi:hypothetical protein